MEEDGYLCPSFNSYSTNNSVAEIAAKISDEFKRDCDEFDDLDCNSNHQVQVVEVKDDDENEDDFEFSLVCENSDVSLGEFFYDRQIQPIFPVFNRDLLLNGVSYDDVDRKLGVNDEDGVYNSIQTSLKDLFLEDQREPASSSSSEVDELESIPPGTYCVWKPKLTEPSPSRCKKSNSTGSSTSSKRWKNIRDLLRRSNSEGKDNYVFLTPKKGTKKNEISSSKSKEAVKVAAAGKLKLKDSSSSRGSVGGGVKQSPAAAHYLRNKAAKELDKNKRKSYLPYRQDLVGFFTNVNGLGRSFPSF